ncbi:malate synthase G [Aestuariibacter halophilus]|uniref:Malate synthase G n=1 Tax=Fluctibacter halophilus TaxID=226011 RepID=A0ABS8G2U8_9ALTE|nr:malate synthase G [Aestuariibacter halophilus]MCC2614912.1 malate synthase G [Aestuariibacter halophilus]
MQNYVTQGRLSIDQTLYSFIHEAALPGSQVDSSTFWQGFEDILADLMPQNAALLAKRDALQAAIDTRCQQGDRPDPQQWQTFLHSIGYFDPEPAGDCVITTQNVDPEIATQAGPQLVVPINNARYALNAANARWGSLYDALYGTDIIAETDGAEKGQGYNPKRGAKVIEHARAWLDVIAPLTEGSHKDSTGYHLSDDGITVSLKGGRAATLQDAQQLIGYQGDKSAPEALLLVHNGLHVELQIDPQSPVGRADPAGLKDIVVEAALTTIMDCEDSVAAVDAEDKTLVYQNWLGLMQGNLSIEMRKGDKILTRSLNADRHYTTLQGDSLQLPGRSLMFVRNVGHLMTNDAILFEQQPIPEGIMDAMLTALIGKHDLLGNGPLRNSRTGSIYIVKPKMHGAEEVAFTDTLFARVEHVLGLAPNTLKMGIMDEERRTTVNLKACIAAAKDRVVFINTGFLDRTGDEIHTSMYLGPFAPKGELKSLPWIGAYERANVQVGLACGLSGKAQIGKGMWPVPDNMADMMAQKIAHPRAGASTAWVPSPTAATLHALHYHQEDVFALQRQLPPLDDNNLLDILTVPLLDSDRVLSEQDKQNELDNNVQGILGYVVRWVHQGIGCSKVPDIHNVGLMEDRATLRISSQHIANWLEHGIVTRQQVEQTLQRMAVLVDEQNAGDADYIPMQPDPASSPAYQAAEALIFEGKAQPNGYTEPMLHAKRREMKARLASR